MKLQFTAQCSDMFSANLIDDDRIIGEYNGYVPKFMHGEHWGDYVQLTIDLETGQIENWEPVSQDEIDSFKESDGYEAFDNEGE